MRPSFSTFQISWKAFTDKGSEWVEETIGLNSVHKMLYGPIPDRKTAEALVAERKDQVTKLYVGISQATKAKLETPKVLS